MGAHGYMAEYFVSDVEYLVPIPESITEYGFFIEPASLVEKALDQAFAARSRFDWQPSNAMALGNGNLGLLALARLVSDERFDQVYCVGRRDPPDPTIDFIKQVGGTYINSQEVSIDEVKTEYGGMDYIFESTGYPRHAIDAVSALGSNGVATLQGIPGSNQFEIDGGNFHSDLVVNNKALLGVVNSRKLHFEAATEWLNEIPRSVLCSLVTGRYAIDEVEAAFENSNETIKSVIDFC